MKFEHQPPKTKSRLNTIGMSVGEKRRLALMVGGLVVVGAVMLTTLYKARSMGTTRDVRPLPDESAGQAPVLAVPELDVARVEELVADEKPSDRVVLESEAADLVLDAARRYTARHYDELDAPELDAALVAELEANPAAARGEPFVARGRIVELAPRPGAAHEDQYLGRLELDDGAAAHFLVLSVPEHAVDLGGYVRVDGLFMKVYSTEDQLTPGQWTAGPLLVGARAVRSYPALGEVTQLDWSAFDDLQDADLAPADGGAPVFVPETPPLPFWNLMAYARDLPEDALDWDEVPVLDQRLLDQILENPASFRARPFRIPISRLQDGRVRVAGENPARIERFTQGWIGNTTWRSVLHFRTPVLAPELQISDLVYGRGFFLHDFSYESSERGLRVAPVFVLQDLARHIPEPSPVLMNIPWVLGGIGLGLGLMFWLLARRDRRRSAEFHEEIVRRRRARRERGKGGVGTAST